MKLFNHSPEQVNALLGLTRDCAQKLIGINFKQPSEDHENMRYHAYLKGKMELLQALLNDDFEVEQPATQQE